MAQRETHRPACGPAPVASFGNTGFFREFWPGRNYPAFRRPNRLISRPMALPAISGQSHCPRSAEMRRIVFGPTIQEEAMRTLQAAIIALSISALSPLTAEAQGFGGGNGFDPSRLQGQSVGSAQGDLAGRGFTKARNIRIGAAQWDLWYNGRDRNSCVGFTSWNGRITQARTFGDSDCGRDSADNRPRPPGAGPGPGGRGFDFDRLRRMRVPEAQASLSSAGFSKARNIRISGTQWDLWYNRRDRNSCIGFTSYYGVVTGVRPFGDRDCGDNGGGWDRPPPRDYNLSRLNGLRVGAAQQSLASDGFGHSRNIRINGKQWDLWRNDRYRNSCIGFTSYNGLVTGARTFGDRDCG
jgi:hypothetical protein